MLILNLCSISQIIFFKDTKCFSLPRVIQYRNMTNIWKIENIEKIEISYCVQSIFPSNYAALRDIKLRTIDGRSFDFRLERYLCLQHVCSLRYGQLYDEKSAKWNDTTARKIGSRTLNGHRRLREIRGARVPPRRRIYNAFLTGHADRLNGC